MILSKRGFLRLACLLAACALLWPLPFWKGTASFVVQVSPFVAVGAILAGSAITIGTGIGLVVAVASVLRSRWFCRHACPVGLLIETMSGLGMKKSRGWERFPIFGRGFAVVTIAGAIVGYPLLLWLDPLAILSNVFSARTAHGVVAVLLASFGLLSLLFSSFIWGPVWCARLCPLGGMLDLLFFAGRRFQQMAGAKAACPEPSFAKGKPRVESRRFFLLSLFGFALGMLGRGIGAARSHTAPLRPPSAVAESSFTGLCLRCGNCLRSCPERVIRADMREGGVAGWLAPVLSYERSYCRESCIECTGSCPSGALRPMTLEEKRRYIIGEAVLEMELCVLALGQRDCDACARSCPFDAIHVHWDEEQYIAYPVVDRNKCNGCGACEAACPTRGEKAIRVWRRVDRQYL